MTTVIERPNIKDDRHLIALLSGAVRKLLSDHKDDIEIEIFVGLSYLSVVGLARNRVGTDNYKLLQDIADEQVTELLMKSLKKETPSR